MLLTLRANQKRQSNNNNGSSSSSTPNSDSAANGSGYGTSVGTHRDSAQLVTSSLIQDSPAPEAPIASENQVAHAAAMILVDEPGPAQAPPRAKASATVLTKVHQLAKNLKDTRAAAQALGDSAELKTARDNVKQRAGWVKTYDAKLESAGTKLTELRTKLNGARMRNDAKAVTRFEADVATAQSAFERAGADVDHYNTELSVAQETEALLGQRLAAANSETTAAKDTLLRELASREFDFELMSVTELALLSMDLAPESVVPDQFKEAMSTEVTKRFDQADLNTVDAIAGAYQDGFSSAALARAITGMKPDSWAALFMTVQAQDEGEALTREDPFVTKLIEKIGSMDLKSIKGLNRAVPDMKATAQGIYVNALDAAIPRSVLDTVHLNDEAFGLLSEKFIAHKESWSALHPDVAGQEPPYLANLTTTELSTLFAALGRESRWSASATGRAVVADVRSRFRECLMATNDQTAPAELAALAKAAKSTSYVENLPLREVRPLFEMLQRDSRNWLTNPSPDVKALVDQVNNRFLREYLPSISAATDQGERNSLADGFRDFANKWNAEVAAVGSALALAQESTAFGTLSTDEVADLFVKMQSVSSLLPNSDAFVGAVKNKFAASYKNVQLDTHSMLTSKYPNMSPAGQNWFGQVANRPPEQLLPLLIKVFGRLPRLEINNNTGSATALQAFDAAIKYRTTLPGSDPGETSKWLETVLPLVNASGAIALWANMPGVFRTASLTADRVRHEYFETASRVAQRHAAPRWTLYAAQGPIAALFEDQTRLWTPALQKHFEGLFKLLPDERYIKECKYHLRILETFQSIDPKKGIYNFTATRMLEKFQKIAPDGRNSTPFLRNFAFETERLANEPQKDRADALLLVLDKARDESKKALLSELAVRPYAASNKVVQTNRRSPPSALRR